MRAPGSTLSSDQQRPKNATSRRRRRQVSKTQVGYNGCRSLFKRITSSAEDPNKPFARRQLDGQLLGPDRRFGAFR